MSKDIEEKNKEKNVESKSPAVTEEKKPKKGDLKKEKKEETKEAKKVVIPKKQHGENFKYIVRLVNTDLNGEKSVERALTEIRGIGARVAVIIADSASISRTKELGDITDEEVGRLENAITNLKSIIPFWLLNRQRDYETGQSYHLFSTDVQLKVRDDINLMKKIRCYKGIRHEQGQKVRGQRTRSNGRTGLAVGVTKAAAAAQAAAQQAAEKEKGGEKGGKAAPAAAPSAAPEKAAAPAPEKK